MRKKDEMLSKTPKQIKSENGAMWKLPIQSWYYEEKQGFKIIIQLGSEYAKIVIPWSTILASVKRYLTTKGKKIV